VFYASSERSFYSGYNPHGVQYVPQRTVRVTITVARNGEILFRGTGASGTTSMDRDGLRYATEEATRTALANLR